MGGDPFVDIHRIRAVRAILDQHSQAPGSKVLPLLCDANTGWLRHQALQVIESVKHLQNVYIEQPCLTYEECLSVREHCPLPMVLDECMDDIGENLHFVFLQFLNYSGYQKRKKEIHK